MIVTSLDLSAKPDLVWLARLVADVRIAAPETEFLLAGAQARDLLLAHAHGIDTGRATEDVDLAFMVASWDDFHLLRKRLIASGRFEHTKSPQRLKHQGVGNSNVDIIPFAGVEDAQRHIAWPPDSDIVMNVIGFREAHEVAIAVGLPEAMSVDVPPLGALVLLKLAAWADRRLIPPIGKDAHDIRLLLKHYLAAGNQERLYTVAGHLLNQTDFDFEVAGAWLLGRDARVMLNESATAASSVPFYLTIVQREATASTESLLLGDMRSPNPASDLRILGPFAKDLLSRVRHSLVNTAASATRQPRPCQSRPWKSPTRIHPQGSAPHPEFRITHYATRVAGPKTMTHKDFQRQPLPKFDVGREKRILLGNLLIQGKKSWLPLHINPSAVRGRRTQPVDSRCG